MVPSHLSDIVHMYLAVAHSEPGAVRPLERDLALKLASRWAPRAPREEVAAVVDTAYLAVERGTPPEIGALTETLCATLSHEDCLRILTDLGVIVRATGGATSSTAGVITLVRGALA